MSRQRGAESDYNLKAGLEPVPSSFELPANIKAIAWVALFNDISSEAAYWLLPQFLVTVLGAGTAAFGLIEGSAETVASFARLASGFLSDRLRRRKPIAAGSYSLANAAKPLLALCTSWTQVFWIRFVDRASKGIRVPARDALIADSIPAARLGAAFGFHQAMDTAGAILGPLAAALLVFSHFSLRAIFGLAGIPGLVAIVLSWVAVREIRPGAREPQAKLDRGPIIGEARGRIRVILVATALFALGNSSDLFLVLRAQNLGVAARFAPVLGLVFNTVYALLSWPLGHLSDRVQRSRLIISGYLVYAAVYFGFARASEAWLAWLLFPIYGLYYALTEGVLKAWIADLAPSRSRASAYGVFNWATAVCALPASVMAGWLWRAYGPAAPFEISAILAVAAALLLLAA